MSIVDSTPPSATVVAEGECRVLSLNKNILLQKLATDMAFGCRFYKAVAVFLTDRLREIEHPVPSDDREELVAETISKDEIDDMIVGNVARAAGRFDRMMQILAGT
jgi:CRP/FNR family cyclic AMP-dependent transcriptional regulator